MYRGPGNQTGPLEFSACPAGRIYPKHFSHLSLHYQAIDSSRTYAHYKKVVTDMIGRLTNSKHTRRLFQVIIIVIEGSYNTTDLYLIRLRLSVYYQ